MPDPNRKLTAAVVEVSTQLRRIADHLTTDVADTTDAPTTTPDDVSAPLLDRLAKAERAADLLADQYRGLEEQLAAARSHAAAADRDDYRQRYQAQMHAAGDLIEKLGQAEQRAEQAEERRNQLAATLAKVLSHFIHKGHPGEPCLSSGWVAEKTVAQWRAALLPSAPAAEEQPVPDFTSPLTSIEVRQPCPYCGDRQMVPSHQFAEHVARLHPEEQRDAR